MALHGEISIRPHNGRTRVDVNIAAVRGGLEIDLWEHSLVVNISPEAGPADVAAWLCASLRPLLESLAARAVVDWAEEHDSPRPSSPTEPQPALFDEPLP